MTVATHRVLPNFFVVGAPRSGTTVLDRALRDHPEVFLCPIKEPNYFAKDIDSHGYLTEHGFANVEVSAVLDAGDSSNLHFAAVKDFADYLALFRDAKGARAIGECSTSYLLSECAAAEIYAAVPHARIIMILREPVSRALSHYRMLIAQGLFHGTLSEAVKSELARNKLWAGVIGSGLYLRQVERFLERFDRSRIFIALTEDLGDWPNFSSNLARFLEIDPQKFAPTAPRVNESRSPRFPIFNYWTRQLGVLAAVKPLLPESLRQSFSRMYFRDGSDRPLSDEDRAQLGRFFEPEIPRLGPLIGRDLSHWLAPASNQGHFQNGTPEPE